MNTMSEPANQNEKFDELMNRAVALRHEIRSLVDAPHSPTKAVSLREKQRELDYVHQQAEIIIYGEDSIPDRLPTPPDRNHSQRITS
ncbi:hypothetical protein [Vibrio nigripulchritudo]|uniref:hypothetical protein n=1 Tax=Vibrio nigripulchritudo TaxID=28173 RepID=UPI00248FF76F|nr:hypothetical protein [Vibrio nigripulchritudo]BDU40199.1 hypothetical protein TUMSATVNIG2_46680 [Vibrio nigripulchritudo]BDU45934.1 hypothetical protein TUMSATVNIG3_47320 [Vibrio nigripulchritudo]